MDSHDVQQVQHIARLAFLGMAARAVAACEFETSPEVSTVAITVVRDRLEPYAEITFLDQSQNPLGGMTI